MRSIIKVKIWEDFNDVDIPLWLGLWLSFAVPCRVVLCCDVPCCAACVLSCCVMLCCVVWCYVEVVNGCFKRRNQT